MKLVLIMDCSACKTTISNQRCPAKALNGLLFCGRHAKTRNVRLWAEVNNANEKAIKIQKIWRGYLYRNWIKESGVGCLKRSLCHNDDEMVTMDHKSRVHPLDYFSFEEDGKVWWFDFRSIFSVVFKTLHPVNPYTRAPISLNDRIRIREIYHRRMTFNMPTYYTSPIRKDLYTFTWIFISQILEEHGFGSIHPNLMNSLEVSQYLIFVVMFLKELKILTNYKPTVNRSHKLKSIVKLQRFLKNINQRIIDGLFDKNDISFEFAKLFASIFNDIKNPYSYCYIFASIFPRL